MKGRRIVSLLLTAAGLCGALPPSHAQTSFSVTALSDFRVRGLSYSEKEPVLQAGVNHDFHNGVYAGALASRARVRASTVSGTASFYAGWAHGNGALNWDVGVVRTLYGDARQYRYHEWYAGVGVERLSGRLSYAPAYLGTGGRTAYLEINGSYPLAEWLEASAHLGYLKPMDERAGWYYMQLQRPDWRLGLGAFSGDWSFQLAWSGTRKAAGVFPGWRYGETRGLVLGATRHF